MISSNDIKPLINDAVEVRPFEETVARLNEIAIKIVFFDILKQIIDGVIEVQDAQLAVQKMFCSTDNSVGSFYEESVKSAVSVMVNGIDRNLHEKAIQSAIQEISYNNVNIVDQKELLLKLKQLTKPSN